MQKLPFVALQTAIYAALTGALSCRVYDEPPRDTDGTAADFPFALIGEVTYADDSPKNGYLMDCTATVTIWSDKAGFAEANSIANTALSALVDAPLNLGTDFEIVRTSAGTGGTGKDSTSYFRFCEIRPVFTIQQL